MTATPPHTTTPASERISPALARRFKTTTIEFRRPHLYPKQLAAIYDPKRISAIEASTKAGKTYGCIVWLIEQALAGGGNGRNYWWVAPVSTQADIAFTRMLRLLPKGTFTANRTLKTVVLLNGAVIWFKGADRPDTLYGEDVHAAVIDEASRLKETAWEAVRSTLVATRGKLRLIGNVKGRKNWFYRIARRAQQGAVDIGYHKITAYDAVAAGVLHAGEIESARSEMSDHAFRELFLAEASDDEGNPFGIAAIARCIVPALSSRPVATWGFDLGKSVDWTVGIGLDDAGDVCRFARWQHVPWPQTKQRIIRLAGRTPALVDSTGLGDPVLEDLQLEPGSRFEGFKFTGSSKQQLMEGLAVAIQSEATHLPDGQIRHELEAFEYEFTRTGVRYRAADGSFDDCVCAYALAISHKGHARRPYRITDKLLARASLPYGAARR